MKQLLHRLWSDDSGQDLIEYALIATLLVLVIITGMNGLAGSIKSDYSRIGTSM
ncbi:MAG: Flp family type IVb pilin [Acidobacteriaceae bacterium]